MLAARIVDILLEAKEKIVASALRFPDGAIVDSDFHASCMLQALEMGKFPPFKSFEEVQDAGLSEVELYDASNVQAGFLTSKGRFVNREEAYRIAVANRIITPSPHGDEQLDASQLW